MVKIDQHISDLLYDHDCVIVPEMGGFLGSYLPASIHPVQHSFLPPSKKMAFNVFLKHNDGLLADYIAQRESLSYTEALKKIREYVERYDHELKAGQKFIINKVGVLYMDAEHHIQFEPFKNANYLRNSFGLSAIQCLPVTVENTGRDKEFVKSRPSIRLKPELLSKSKKINMVNTVLIAGSILWFVLNVYFVSPPKFNFASLNPFADTVLNKEAPSVTVPVPQPTILLEKSAISINENDSVSNAAINNSSSSLLNNESGYSDDKFFLITGAFRSMRNATKMAEELKGKGFAGTTIVESKNGFKLVACQSFKAREEALTALIQLKEENAESWIYSSR